MVECYTDFQAWRTALDSGKELGMLDGVLINGKRPCRYNSTLALDGIGMKPF